MSSDEQIEANRKNAQMSTGPITDDGKKIVSKNAVVHGILSREVVISTPELQEHQEDFDRLKQSLTEDYQPFGVTEGILVERIAISYWRLRRVLRAEKGEIRKQSDNAVFNKELERIKIADDHALIPDAYSLSERLLNSVSSTKIKATLEDMKKEVEHTGFMSKDLLSDYMRLMDGWKNKSEAAWMYFFNEIAQGKIDTEDKEKGKKALILTLDRHLEHCSMSYKLAKDLEKDQNDAHVYASSVPVSDASEKLQRYETMLENQLYRAINQLIKLQTLRKGGKVASLQATEVEIVEP